MHPVIFGMRRHIGVDADTGPVHMATCTPAIYADASQCQAATADTFGFAETPSIRAALDAANKAAEEIYGTQGTRIDTRRFERRGDAKPDQSRSRGGEREAGG